MRKKVLPKTLVMSVLCAIGSVGFTIGGYAEEKANYSLEGVTVTESRYYDDKVIRTGGNVDIITSEDIEKHNYPTVLDAIKRLPGVDVQESGTKAIEYGYGNYHDTISINGDKRVIILLDGKRLGNDASSSVGDSFGKAQLFAIIGIQNVERIEVIKGAAAMAYGSDCTGGVINIITKKGDRSNTTLDAAYGSSSKQKYVVSNSGKKDKLSWLASYNKDRRGDMKYVDREYKKTRTYQNSGWNEDNTFLKFNYDFDEKHSVEVSHAYKHLKADYPIEAPDYSAYDYTMAAINDRSHAMSFRNASAVPYSNPEWYRYHRWWYVFGAGSYTTTKVNNFDVKYTFKDKDNIDNYIRIFHNKNNFYMDRLRPMGNYGNSSDGTLLNYSELEREQFSWAEEISKGINFRFGKKLNDNNTLYTGIDYSKNSVSTRAIDKLLKDFAGRGNAGDMINASNSKTERDAAAVFIQDKISFNKFTITPGMRYNYTGKGEINTSSYNTGKIETESFSKITLGLFTNYDFNKSNSVYASWSQIYNAPYPASMYKISSGKLYFNDLKAEKGDAFTLGYKGKMGKSNYGVNYTLTKLDNTYGLYKFVDNAGDEISRTTNIENTISSIGLNYDYSFDDTWSLKASYSHAKDDPKLTARSAITTTDQMRNALHFTNKYTTSLNYEKGKFSSGLDMTYYTGMDTRFFSDNRYLILDWHLNYKLNKNTRAYLLVNNITNRSYETKSTTSEGIGCMPMEGRNFLIGLNYNF